MSDSDYMTDRKRHIESWDEHGYYAQRLAGALIETVCPGCTLTVGAMVINNDNPWIDLVCPACDFEFTERTV